MHGTVANFLFAFERRKANGDVDLLVEAVVDEEQEEEEVTEAEISAVANSLVPTIPNKRV